MKPTVVLTLMLLSTAASLRSITHSNPPIFPRSMTTMLFSNMDDEASRSVLPGRCDFCRIVFSGQVGSIPKEIYLTNGHYKVTFDLALTGHFSALHERERYSPTETSWIPSEVWDDVAKYNHKLLQKGARLQAVGVLKTDRWVDKTSGEERRKNIMRITKLLTDVEFLQLAAILNDIHGSTKGNVMSDHFDSGFSSDFPRGERSSR